MKIHNVVKMFGISEEVWHESFGRQDVMCETFEDVSYYRVRKKVGLLERGAIVTPEGVLFAYPRIARILHLENGIRASYAQPFYIEEKIDGYNVRIARIKGRVLAFTRGAYVCPFSTDRIVDFLDVKHIFDENPELIICGEFAGPDNPYNKEYPPYVTKDVGFFSFDLMMLNKSYTVSVEEGYKIFDAYSIPTTKRFGRFSVSDVSRIKEIINELDDRGCEGIVMKPIRTEEKPMKHVTLGSCFRDIRITAPLMIQMQPEFFTHRIIRAAMFIHEYRRSLDPETFSRLGEAMLKPVYESVAKAARGELIEEKFLLRFREEKNVQKMIDHLNKCKVTFGVLSKKKVDAYWVVEFTRKYYASYDSLRTCLEGMPHID
ncbi:MAG: RNA ligase [Candidatus Brocadiaceae bacterium]|nr:RNA ligase [Candidatus Brocadiaceae bacterium]